MQQNFKTRARPGAHQALCDPYKPVRSPTVSSRSTLLPAGALLYANRPHPSHPLHPSHPAASRPQRSLTKSYDSL